LLWQELLISRWSETCVATQVGSVLKPIFDDRNSVFQVPTHGCPTSRDTMGNLSHIMNLLVRNHHRTTLAMEAIFLYEKSILGAA
jgi:hypothetical protein